MLNSLPETINIFSLNINFVLFLIISLSIVFICVFFIIYKILKKISISVDLKQKNIMGEKTKKHALINKFLKHVDKEQLQLKLIHSGHVLGITNIEIYFVYRVIFVIAGLILGIELYSQNILYSIIVIIFCGLLGFLVMDLILYNGKKKRIKSIKEQIPAFLISFDNYTKAGLLFDDILDIIPNLVKNELQKELIRFNVNYSLSKDFEGSIKEFTKRLGFIESEELELKMRQCYYSGIYDDILTNEKELIEKKVINDMKKETQVYSLYLTIAMSLTIINIFILVVVPLLGAASEGMKFLKM